MGQLIAFPQLPTPYPDLAADLDKGESILLLAIRWWGESFREGEDPIPCLLQGLETVGTADAAFSIDGLMSIVARVARRPVDIRCPHCPRLSDNEKHLLRAVCLAQNGSRDMAEKALRTTLLSPQAAEFALGPLEGLAEIFAKARLFLSPRRLSGDDQAMDDSRESWSPSTLH
jgi:hypothetical protein